jgi:outer membrane biosynthesis protein TonB
MQRSYLVKSSVHFADFGFFVKVGDILVHDPANSNKLTVYRNGAVVRDVKQTSLGLAAMVKNEVLVEVATPDKTPTAAPRTPAKPIPAPKPEPKPAAKEEKPKKEASAVNWGGVDMSTKPKAEKPAAKPAPKPKPVEIEDETI